MVAERSPAAKRHVRRIADAPVAIECCPAQSDLRPTTVRKAPSARTSRQASAGVSQGGPCRSIAMSISSPTASRKAATLRTGSVTPPHLIALMPRSLAASARSGVFAWRVDRDPVADLAAEQHPDRHAERLALDVPKRHVDAGHGARRRPFRACRGPSWRYASSARAARYCAGSSPISSGARSCDRRLDDPRPARAFTDAGDALVGIELQEQPVPGARRSILDASSRERVSGGPFRGGRLARMHEKSANSGDLHRTELPFFKLPGST